jgi:hypothetical protein
MDRHLLALAEHGFFKLTLSSKKHIHSLRQAALADLPVDTLASQELYAKSPFGPVLRPEGYAAEVLLRVSAYGKNFLAGSQPQ